MTDSFNEKMLAAALASGQPDQLRAARERHLDAMMLLIRSFTGSTDEEAGQLLDEIWACAAADFPLGDAGPRGHARTWLYVHLLGRIDYAAAASTGMADTALPEFEPEEHHWEGGWKADPVPWRPRPEEWEHTEQGQASLKRVIAGLPPAERVVLVARDLDGWSLTQVQALGPFLPQETRDMLLSARLRVRAAIDAVLGEKRQPAGEPVAGGGGDHG
jgi:DNA-directed RNA polymerase specialized sigma24 family protein